MEFKWHFLIGFVTSYILVYFFEFSLLAGLVIFISSWLIDGDHYFWYALEMKDWNPLNAVKWYLKSIPLWFGLKIEERRKFRRGVFILHGLPFWIILALLGIIIPFFMWVLLGVAIHMVADLIDLKLRGEPLYNKIFPCLVIKRNKNKQGLKDLW